MYFGQKQRPQLTIRLNHHVDYFQNLISLRQILSRKILDNPFEWKLIKRCQGNKLAFRGIQRVWPLDWLTFSVRGPSLLNFCSPVVGTTGKQKMRLLSLADQGGLSSDFLVAKTTKKTFTCGHGSLFQFWLMNWRFLKAFGSPQGYPRVFLSDGFLGYVIYKSQ